MSPKTGEELPQGVDFAQEESDATRTEERRIVVFWNTIGHVKLGALGAERRGQRNWDVITFTNTGRNDLGLSKDITARVLRSN
jgi:hypothetical protein